MEEDQNQLQNVIEGDDIYFLKDAQTKRYNIKEITLPSGNIEKVVLNCKNWGDITDAEFEHICTELEESSARSIQLSMRSLGRVTVEGIQHLQHAISLNQSCTDINLDFDKCDNITNQILQSISAGLSINEHIQILHINFRYCSFLTNEGIYYFSQCLKRKNNKYTQVHLNFEYCFNLTDESIVYICESLKGSSSLQELTLNFNSCRVSDVGLLTLSETILSCSTIQSLILKLELCEHISDIGLASMSPCLGQKSSLKTFNLSLSSNQEITNKGIKRLFEQFNHLQTNLQSITLQFESIPKITEKILKYVQNVMSASDKKLQSLNVIFRQCPNINSQVFDKLYDLLKSKQTAIQEITLDFTNQSFSLSPLQSSESYRKILDGGVALQSQVQILFGSSKQFFHSDNEHIQAHLNQMNFMKKVSIQYTDIDKQLQSLNESFIQLNSPLKHKSTSFIPPPYRDLSFYLNFVDNKEKNELQVSKVKFHHPAQNNKAIQREKESFKVKLNLQRCNQLFILKDVNQCFKSAQNSSNAKLDIKILYSDINEPIFEATTGLSENANKEDSQNQILDSSHLSSFIYSAINSQIFSHFSLDIQYGFINDKLLVNLTKSMKQNKTIKDWILQFRECGELTDSSLREFFENLNGLSQPINTIKLNLENCTSISDKSLEKVVEFIKNNTYASSIELIFKNSNFVSDSSLQQLQEVIEKDKFEKRVFQIRFVSCSKLSLKHMVLLDKAIKRKNGEQSLQSKDNL